MNTLHEIKLIVLFGSQAKKTAAKTSDYDIAVLANMPLNLEDKIKLTEEISKRFGFNEDKMDLVDLWSAPPLLQYEIAEHGKLIQGSLFDFNRFRILAWKRYLDTGKLRRMREQSLKHRLQHV